MEISILGEYRPFGKEDRPAGQVSKSPTPQKHDQGDTRFDGSTIVTSQGTIFLPQYELHPPTHDGIVSDFRDPHDSPNMIGNPRGAIRFSSNGHENPRGYDAELFIDESKITWTQGGVLRKTFDFRLEHESIRQALFAWFIVNKPSPENIGWDREPDEGREADYNFGQTQKSTEPPGADRQARQQALVVFLKDTAKIYFMTGESHMVHLPFQVLKAWPMDLGIMVERARMSGEDLLRNESDEEGLPRFYVITDPFNEFQVVTLYKLPQQIEPSVPLSQGDIPRMRHLNGTIGDICNTCVFMSHLDIDDRTVVTFDILQKRHRIWRYASTTPTTLPFSRTQNPAESAPMSMDVDVEVDADLQMRMDTYMFEIESNIVGASPSSVVFGAHFFDGSMVIGILDQEAGILSCYRIIADQIAERLWSKPAVCAVAVEATRELQRDILMLTADFQLYLWTGFGTELVPCHANVVWRHLMDSANVDRTPKQSAANILLGGSNTKIEASQKKPQIVEIRDSVEDRISIILDNGQILRAQLSFRVRSSMVQEAMDALTFALPVDLFWDFKRRFLLLQFSKESKYEDVPPTSEWGNFSTTLLSFSDPSFSSPALPSRSIPKRAQSSESVQPPTLQDKWNALLASDIHRKLISHPSLKHMRPIPEPTSNPNKELLKRAQRLATAHFKGPSTRLRQRLDQFYKYILVALHLVYQNRALNMVTRTEGEMKPLLVLLSHMVEWKSWVDFYVRHDFSKSKSIELPEVYMEGTPLPLEQYRYEPPDIFRWISNAVSWSRSSAVASQLAEISNKGPVPRELKAFPTLSSIATLRDPEQTVFPRLSSPPCDLIRKVTLVFTALVDEVDGSHGTARALVNEAFTGMQLDQLPFGVSIPLREALWMCRRNPPLDMESDALSLIGRDDLAELKSGRSPGYYMKPPPLMKKDEPVKRTDIHTLCEEVTRKDGENEVEITGTEITESEITKLRFGEDMRVAEVQRMLQSSNVIKVTPKLGPNLSDDELNTSHQKFLCKIAQRTLALSVGRAILTFGTATPTVTQRCPVPPITLAVKLLPSFGVVELDMARLGNEHILNWPNFHNGVAAGLRISPNSTDISSSWIMYNKPETLDCEHAGFLLALGLTGHLRVLERSQVLKYLRFQHEMTATGLLLGLGCAYRGTMHTAITGVLSVHIRALVPVPQGETPVHFTPLKQVACVLGLGLIYMESSYRRMAEVMLREIASSSGDAVETVQGLQECHSVAAGFALGFITLGHGDTSMGLNDMKIVDVLVTYIPGSTDLNRGVNAAGVDQGWNRRDVGIDMTSAGATIAIGLMYLKTNNKSIAAKLGVPETQFLLDYVSPDSLILRVICRSIILWDSILPTEEWVVSQVPDYLKNPKSGGPPKSETGLQSYYSILAGACFAMGLRYAGSGYEPAYKCILMFMDMFLELGRTMRDGSYEESIVKSTVRTCLDVTTLAASMVVAGSGRVDFLQRVRKLHRRIHGESSYGNHMAYHMAMGLLFLGGGGYTLGTSNRCVAALLCGLYPKLPSGPADNKSHLQAFRHLWVLAVEPRCLVTRDASTGACCPVPVRLHLKATGEGLGGPLFHTDQGRKDSVDHHRELIRMGKRRADAQILRQGSTAHHEADMAVSVSVLDLMTPCLLPDLSTISKIEILGPRYWPITLDLSDEQEDYSRIWRILRSRSIAVMRHSAHLSYIEDPLGMRGIEARPFPNILALEDLTMGSDIGDSRRQKVERMQRVAELERRRNMGQGEGHSSASYNQEMEPGSASYGKDFWLTFLQDPLVTSFASTLCTPRSEGGDHDDDVALEKGEAKAAYFTGVLYECLTVDKVDALGVHIWLHDIANRLENLDEISWYTLWELKIVKRYYDTQRKRYHSETAQHHGIISDGKRGSRPARRPIVSLEKKMMEDDGSETLVKIKRITELFSMVLKRVNLAMGGDRRRDIGLQPLPMEAVANHYFSNGSFPVDVAMHMKGSGTGASNIAQSKMDWFKVWLELHEIPGPCLLESLKSLMRKTRDIWHYDNFGQTKKDGNAIRVRDRPRSQKVPLEILLAKAFPEITVKVLKFLVVHSAVDMSETDLISWDNDDAVTPTLAQDLPTVPQPLPLTPQLSLLDTLYPLPEASLSLDKLGLDIDPHFTKSFQSTASFLLTPPDEQTNDNVVTVPDIPPDQYLVPRLYQMELFKKAINGNVIAVMDTGSGKTLVAVMLIKEMISREREAQRKPEDRKVCFFVVNNVPLVFQQASVIKANCDAKVYEICGTTGDEKFNDTLWQIIYDGVDVVVLTAQILLNVLRHGKVNMDRINLLVFDECHHTGKNHPFCCIMREFYHTSNSQRPKVFGMTASPSSDVGSKFSNSARELEELLDCKVFTADQDQIKEFVERPKEIVIQYNTAPAYSTTELTYRLRHECSMVARLASKFESAGFNLEHLGPWCVDRLWKVFVESMALKANMGSLALEDNAALRVIQSWAFSSPILTTEHMTPKVLKLIQILRASEKSLKDDFCGIIFVQRRDTALALGLLLHEIEEFQDIFRVAVVAGHSDENESVLRMSYREQTSIISEFRKKKLNLLVSTSVAEEGLDIQPCNIVIRFDPATTTISYIQSRGRARKKDSRYIMMQEIDNRTEEAALERIQYGEKSMKEWCRSLDSERLMRSPMEEDEESATDALMLTQTYRVPSTGALLTLDSAVSLLHYYCSTLSGDEFCSLRPHFDITPNGSSGFVCDLTLPPNAPVRFLQSDHTSTKSMAKKSAAFKACEKLHALGALNDNLLPITTSADKDGEDGEVQTMEKGDKNKSYPLDSPTFWSHGPTSCGDTIALYVCVVRLSHGDLECLGGKERYRTMCLLTHRPLPCDVAPINLYAEGAPRVVTLKSYPSAISVDKGQIEKLQLFTLALFQRMTRRTFQCELDGMPYFVAPLSNGSISDHDPPLDIAWDDVELGMNLDAVSVPEKSIDDDRLSKAVLTLHLDRCRDFTVKKALRDVRMQDVMDPDLFHRELAFCEDFKAKTRSADSSESEKQRENNLPTPVTFAFYFKLKYHVDCPDDDVILLLDRVRKMRNHLQPATQDEGKGSDTHTTVAPLSVCLYSTVKADVLRMSQFFPSVLFSLDETLLVNEAREKVGMKATRLDLLQVAYTTSSANREYQYERLELLGDSFLKFSSTIRLYIVNPAKNEGELHMCRIRIISNKALLRHATRLQLYRYVSRTPFHRKSWRPARFVVDNKPWTDIQNHILSNKTLADVIEASLGAAYLSGGVRNGLQAAKAMGIPFEEFEDWDDFVQVYSNRTAKDNDTQGTLSAAQRVSVQEVQKVLGYTFRNPLLLIEAMTHASHIRLDAMCYQRLEFLGDAVLDFQVVQYYYNKYADAPPGAITLIKDASVNNGILGAISIRWGLHKFLNHYSPTLISAIARTIVDIESKEEESKDKGLTGEYWVNINMPKVLGDVVESTIGAVFVDSGFDFEVISDLFTRLIRPFLDKHVNFESICIHPTKALIESLQSQGCHKFKFEHVGAAPAVAGANRILRRLAQGLDNDKLILHFKIHDKIIATVSGAKTLDYLRKEVALATMEKLNTDPLLLSGLCTCIRKKQVQHKSMLDRYRQ
ncbi:Anaphase-promoting complex subunit 1 [Mortierella polycephala]|uniref:Anaphase-promoting complex subunit 1 n=1 Tax=Mortierella polycephala TaxID=41804 RepID=A0A9P6Q6C8_9FUNG|nr:Anaphase-promoting complex subunit 1 [Mortierella polycephala]